MPAPTLKPVAAALLALVEALLLVELATVVEALVEVPVVELPVAVLETLPELELPVEELAPEVLTTLALDELPVVAEVVPDADTVTVESMAKRGV